MKGEDDGDESRPEGSTPAETRRDFLKLVFALGTVGTIVGMAGFFTEYLTFIPGSGVTYTSWPRLKVANLSALEPLKPILFNYPLTNTPNLLVKLGVKAEKGIGPDGDVVAFSQICQHLGCIYGFQAEGSSPSCNSSYVMPSTGGYCCCHGSHYDFAKEGAVIGGPSPRPQPMVSLDLDEATGDIYAVGMGPPSIYGHETGATDPKAVLSADLTGGNLVAGATFTATGAGSTTGTNSTSTAGQ